MHSCNVFGDGVCGPGSPSPLNWVSNSAIAASKIRIYSKMDNVLIVTSSWIKFLLVFCQAALIYFADLKISVIEFSSFFTTILHLCLLICERHFSNRHLPLIPTAYKMSFFPRDSAPPIVTIVGGLLYSPNCAWCRAVMLGTCAGYFCLKKIKFVALAIKISSYIIFELRQNSMHFMKKSHRWRVEIIWIFFV